MCTILQVIYTVAQPRDQRCESAVLRCKGFMHMQGYHLLSQIGKNQIIIEKRMIIQNLFGDWKTDIVKKGTQLHVPKSVGHATGMHTVYHQCCSQDEIGMWSFRGKTLNCRYKFLVLGEDEIVRRIVFTPTKVITTMQVQQISQNRSLCALNPDQCLSWSCECNSGLGEEVFQCRWQQRKISLFWIPQLYVKMFL